jgi:hypothetical protein
MRHSQPWLGTMGAIISFIVIGAVFFSLIQITENALRKALTKRRLDKLDAMLAQRKKSDYQK